MNRLFIIVIILLLAVSPLYAQDEKIGAFTYSHNLDDFTDEDRRLIITQDLGEDGLLSWRCMSDGLNILLHVGGYMGGDSDDDILVRYRFDKNDPSEFGYWRLLPGQNRIAYIRMNKVDEFTEDALNAAEVVMEAVDPLDSESRRFRMSLTGLNRAIERLPCAERFH